MNGPEARTGDRARRAARVLERLVALSLGGVLVTSTVGHLGNPYQFLSSVYSYQIVGAQTGRAVAAVLPTIQIAIGLCLALRWWPTGAYLAAIGMFTGFVVVQSIALARGLDISCGCFGADSPVAVGPRTIAVAGGCAVGSVVGFRLSRWMAHVKGKVGDAARP
jgi:hypothetical protein